MSDSKEDSPDWLRSFQPPIQSTIELSSESELPSDHSPVSDDEDDINLSKLFKGRAKDVTDVNDNDDGKDSVANSPAKGMPVKKNNKAKRTPEKKRKNEDGSEREGKRSKGKDTNRKNTPEKHGKRHEQNHSIWSLSSDSESSPDSPRFKNDKATKREVSADKDIVTENEKQFDDTLLDHVVKSPKTKTSKVKLLEKEDEIISKGKNINSSINEDNDTKDNCVKEENVGKHLRPQGSSSKLPLLLSEKVQRSKALVECEGDSIDLSGDVGSVGRVVILEDHEMFLDLKGTIYKTTIVPSRTFCVVSFGQSEAKIEAIMNDYIQLKSQSNVYEAETMVEGTLDGFSFDSEDEGDKKTNAQGDRHENAEEQFDGKTKTKGKPGKSSGPVRKKGKPAGGKPLKKVKKKPQVSKKGKTKK